MNIVIPCLLVASLQFVACTSKPKKQGEPAVHPIKEVPTPVDSAVIKQAMGAAALKFMNEYLRYIDEKVIGEHENEMQRIRWIVANPMLTPEFKNEYKNLVESYRARDPELGIGADPILEAQDYPDSFTVVAIHPNGYLTLQGMVKGKDWVGFKVKVRLSKIDGQWFIDGSGRINIPEELRIPI